MFALVYRKRKQMLYGLGGASQSPRPTEIVAKGQNNSHQRIRHHHNNATVFRSPVIANRAFSVYIASSCNKTFSILTITSYTHYICRGKAGRVVQTKSHPYTTHTSHSTTMCACAITVTRYCCCWTHFKYV